MKSEQDFISNFGIKDLRYTATLYMGGASAVASLQSAAIAIATGVATNMLCVTGWNGYCGMRVSTLAGQREVPLPMMPFLRDFGMHPFTPAHFTIIEDHQNSRMIADPFCLLDCCLESDGAAAIVVSSAERAKDMRHRPIYIMGIAEGHPIPQTKLPIAP